MNNQNKVDKKIPLVEVFGPTIQGEGAVIGQQTYFLRFGLCDYKCAMCDSLHAVDPKLVQKNAKWLTQAQIFDELRMHHKIGSTKWVTFSGGNPCIHDLSDLCVSLYGESWKIAVETQGTFSPKWLEHTHVVTVSPKTPGMGEIFEIATFKMFMSKWRHHPGLNVKVVVFNREDLATARQIFGYALEYITIDRLYLSQGNPFPPLTKSPPDNHIWVLTEEYKQMFEWISTDPLLSRIKFLPQFHVWLWGNKQGV